MITGIKLNAELNQEVEVMPNWEGDIKRTVMINVKDGDLHFIFYFTVPELKKITKAAVFIIGNK